MAQYDVQSAQIKRRQMIADALRASGNQGVDYAPPSGNRAYRHSSMEGVNKILQQVLGAYLGNRASNEQTALDKQDQANTKQLLDSTQSVEDQGFMRPITDVAGVPNAPAMAQNQALDTDRAAAMRAAALRGVQFGGTAGDLAGAMVQRDVLPPVQQPFTLGEGDTRFDANGQPVATGVPKAYKPSEADRMLVNIVGPDGKKKTIKREDWRGETEWHEPPASSLGGEYNPSETQAAEDQKYAQRIFNLDMDPLPTGTRNPRNIAIMGLVGDLGDTAGMPYKQYEYPARKAALAGFMSDKNNTPGGTVRSFSVMLDHFDTIEKAAQALDNGDVRALNALSSWFKKEFGSGAPSTLEALKHNVQGEIIKGITGGPGAEQDRANALIGLDAATTPAAVMGILQGVRELAGGQLDGLRRSFIEKTGLPVERFEKLLSPAARRLHGSGGENTSDETVVAAPDGPTTADIEAEMQRRGLR
jgi:hypothetical protein